MLLLYIWTPVTCSALGMLSLGLSNFLTEFLTKRPSLVSPHGVQCLLCSASFRDKFNARDHMVRMHVTHVPDLMVGLGQLVRENILELPNNMNSCMLCRKVMKKRTKMDVTIHFVTKHLNVKF